MENVQDCVAKLARVPSDKLRSDDLTHLKNLDTELKKRIFGQNKAVTQVAKAIKLAKSGLRPSHKPLAAFLFSGPTGVGKTELSKQLSQQLSSKYLRFDMSEYMEKHAVSRLIGAPPGYVGHDKGGLLTEAVFKNPYSLVLFDEIEKAHPDMQNILLQVMDRGVLTDSLGREVDFRNTVLILTTNAGARENENGSIGFDRKSDNFRVDEALTHSFSPEFRNRLDAVIHFERLESNEIKKVVAKFINEMNELMKTKNVVVKLTDNAVERIAKQGFDDKFGARPIGRYIDTHVKNFLADEILFGRLAAGGLVMVDYDKEKSTEKNEFEFSY